MIEAQYEKDQAKRGQKRSSGSGYVEAKVTKCIRDNFRHMSEYELYSKEHGGKTLYQRLLHDKKKEAEDPVGCGIKFGKKYMQDLRRAYGADIVSGELEVQDESLLCDPKLIEAVRCSRSAQGSKDKFARWGWGDGGSRTNSLHNVIHVINKTPGTARPIDN